MSDLGSRYRDVVYLVGYEVGPRLAMHGRKQEVHAFTHVAVTINVDL